MSFSDWITQLDFTYVLTVFVSAIAALFSITVHESAHGLIAYRLGDPTAKNAGRITLNPLRHVDLLGLVMLAVAHVGWAKPVPVDMRYFKNPKRGMALTALAGPVSNLLFAFLAMCGFYWCIRLDPGALDGYLALFLENLVLVNCGLALFNVIPIPPLDGSKVLLAFLPQQMYQRWMRYERYGMLVLIVLVYFGTMDGILARGLDLILQWLWQSVASIFAVFHG